MAAGQESLTNLAIRRLEAEAEFREALDVEKRVWGFADVELVPWRLMVVATESGGLVAGAFDGETMIGFSLAFAGVHPDGTSYWHSHMTGVLPEYQNRQVGRQLKLHQRRQAIERGIDLIAWTFDPLEIRNAYFNVVRLGVNVRRLLPNLYGTTTSHLQGALPTDRLVAEWYVKSSRVAAALAGEKGDNRDKQVELTIEVPAKIEELRHSDIKAARSIQTRVREEFQQGFAKGLTVVGYRVSGDGGVFKLGRNSEPV